MLKIYYLNIDVLTLKEINFYFENCISMFKKRQIKNMKFDDDKKRSLLGEVLLYYVLVQKFSIDIRRLKVKRGDYGKPYFDGIDLHFNISHSKNYVICAISTKPVGIDIEKYGRYQDELFDYFHLIEKCRYIALSYCEKRKIFYDLWSMKESYVKYLGMGLFFSLDSFYIQKSSNKINVYRNDNQVFEGNIEQIHIDNSYSCSVCYTVPKIELIKKINSNDLNVLKFET